VRNRIAHDPPTLVVSAVGSTGKGPSSTPPEPFWELTTEQKKLLPDRPNQKTTTKDIIEHIQDVQKLEAAIAAFTSQLQQNSR
jgi:hypothetical protein